MLALLMGIVMVCGWYVCLNAAGMQVECVINEWRVGSGPINSVCEMFLNVHGKY